MPGYFVEDFHQGDSAGSGGDRGGDWPDGTVCATPGDVLILSAEDGLADTIRPRLDAAEGDPTKVHAIEGVLIIDSDGQRGLRPRRWPTSRP